MQPTRRFWGVAAVGVLLAAMAVVVEQPALLLGAAAVAALLLFRAWQFVAATRSAAALDVDVGLSQAYLRQTETTQLTLEATLAAPAAVDVTVSTPTPLAASGAERLEVVLPAGERRATATATLTWELAGVATVDQPTVTFRARDGLFGASVRRGPAPSVVVEPPTPREIHVGEGGDRASIAFGGHRAGRIGQGIDPAELREYVPGDDVGDIDWKATARQNDLYVREYEVETDRRTVLLFDHRGATGVGPAGETVCDYLREVALVFALTAETFDDPLGLYAVGDEGLTAEFAPETGTDQYREIREALHGLAPTTSRERRRPVAGPASAGNKATTLASEDSAFAGTLQPYFAEAGEYVRRLSGEPLFDVARTYLQQQMRGEAQVVVFTDDTDRTTLRETVKVARGGAGHVVVLLAPRVLYEEGGMADLEAAYEEYVDFESFRRELAGIDRVTVFEVAPDDRISAVLRAGRERR